MEYEFDTIKNRINIAKHGISLTDAGEFDWETARQHEDTRKSYPERRHTAVGYLGDRLHVMVLCFRESKIRVISLRKANAREVKIYGTSKT